MGSTVSSTARATARTATKRPPPNPKTHAEVTARLQTKPPPPYQRKTTEQWSETLKQISGAITSSPWQGEVLPHNQNRSDRERHSAQRSDRANQNLPGRRKGQDSLQRDEYGMVKTPKGRLTQNQVLQLFNLRRDDPQKWDATSIANKYGVKEEDVANLLSFSRTYTARADSDGQVRGYYNTDPENTIRRFEKD